MKKKFIVSPIDENIIRDKIIEAALKYDVKASNLFSFNYASILAKEEEALLAAVPDIEVIFTLECYMKMRYLIAGFTKEVAWHGIVERQGSKLVITDIMVPPQVITAATVDADEEQYGPWMMSKGELLNVMRMQGHSHVNMATSPSGTDETYMKTMLNQINDFYIFLIGNKRDEFFVRVYDKTNNIEYNEVAPNIRLGNGLNMQAWFTAESARVREHVYKAPETPLYQGAGYYGQNPNKLTNPPLKTDEEKGDAFDDKYVKSPREEHLSLLAATEEDKEDYRKAKRGKGIWKR